MRPYNTSGESYYFSQCQARVGMYMAKREFYVVITKGEDGCLIGEAPQLRSCYNQGDTVDELIKNMRETIKYCLEEDDLDDRSEFIGVYKIEV